MSGTEMRRGCRRAAALLVAACLVLLGGSCTSASAGNTAGRVIVVDGRGAPVQGALLVLVSEDENAPASPMGLTAEELRERTSDLQGVIKASLDESLWESDGCYHFRVRKAGYEDVTLSVSKDLFPEVLRVELKPREQAPASAPGDRRP